MPGAHRTLSALVFVLVDADEGGLGGTGVGNDQIKVLPTYRTGLTVRRIHTYLLDMSSIFTARVAFLERALIAVTNHCVADILCSR